MFVCIISTLFSVFLTRTCYLGLCFFFLAFLGIHIEQQPTPEISCLYLVIWCGKSYEFQRPASLMISSFRKYELIPTHYFNEVYFAFFIILSFTGHLVVSHFVTVQLVDNLMYERFFRLTADLLRRDVTPQLSCHVHACAKSHSLSLRERRC